MRLIDADSLTLPVKEVKSNLAVILAPTVVAIPIEWIASWICRDDNKDVWADMRVAKWFGKMLEDWGKENEID